MATLARCMRGLVNRLLAGSPGCRKYRPRHVSSIGMGAVDVLEPRLLLSGGVTLTPANQSVDEGKPLNLQVPFTDSTSGSYTAVIHWGDTLSDTASVIDWNVIATHVYADDGTYSATIDLLENGELTPTTAGFTVQVVNQAPTLVWMTPGTIREGFPSTVLLTVADYGVKDDEIGVTYYVDGDTSGAVSADLIGAPWIENGVSYRQLIAVFSSEVSIRTHGWHDLHLTLSDGQDSRNDTAHVYVDETSPELSVYSSELNVSEGHDVWLVLNWHEQFDSRDIVTSWAVDWGDGTAGTGGEASWTYYPDVTGQCTISHRYAPGTYTINAGARVNGDDGRDWPLQTQTATVTNVAPTFDLTVPATASVGQRLVLHPDNLVHPGLPTEGLTYAWTVSGSGGTIVGSAPTFSLQPNAVGTYSVQLTVADEHGGSTTHQGQITVAARVVAAPTIDPNNLVVYPSGWLTLTGVNNEAYANGIQIELSDRPFTSDDPSVAPLYTATLSPDSSGTFELQFHSTLGFTPIYARARAVDPVGETSLWARTSKWVAPLGDFDGNNSVDSADVDALTAAIQSCPPADLVKWDLTGDYQGTTPHPQVDNADRDYLINNVMASYTADFNCDHQVNFDDYLVLESRFGTPSPWERGDATGDGLATFDDYLALEADFGRSKKIAPSFICPVSTSFLQSQKNQTQGTLSFNWKYEDTVGDADNPIDHVILYQADRPDCTYMHPCENVDKGLYHSVDKTTTKLAFVQNGQKFYHLSIESFENLSGVMQVGDSVRLRDTHSSNDGLIVTVKTVQWDDKTKKTTIEIANECREWADSGGGSIVIEGRSLGGQPFCSGSEAYDASFYCVEITLKSGAVYKSPFMRPSLTPKDETLGLSATVAQSSNSQSNRSVTISWAPRFGFLSVDVYRGINGSDILVHHVPDPSLEFSWCDDQPDIPLLPDMIYTYTVKATMPGTGVDDKVAKPVLNLTEELQVATDLDIQDQRGGVILVVDRRLLDDPFMSFRIDRLKRDLIGDGWTVSELPCATDSPSTRVAESESIRNSIKALCGGGPDLNADLNGYRQVILLGHVPIPYSGFAAYDGHNAVDISIYGQVHTGAWPMDTYYGDLRSDVDFLTNDKERYPNGTIPPSTSLNANIPGDGKGDLDADAIHPLLAVGRIDMSDLPAFEMSEFDLLAQYLDRDHAFRTGNPEMVIQQKAAARTRWLGMEGDVLSGDGDDPWKYYSQLVYDSSSGTPQTGIERTRWFDSFNSSDSESFLFGSFAGSGWYTSIPELNTSNLATTMRSNAVFTQLFGSYFGDWNSQNNLMRATLAAGGNGLTCLWSWYEMWNGSGMGLGETIGNTVVATDKRIDSIGDGFSYLAFMGDPSLRMKYVAPASNVCASASGGHAAISWTASSDGDVSGYRVYWADSVDGEFTLVDEVTETRCTDSVLHAVYMVKAIKTETTANGSYVNNSTGVFSVPLIDGIQLIRDSSSAVTEVQIVFSKPIDDWSGSVIQVHHNGKDFYVDATLNAAGETITIVPLQPNNAFSVLGWYNIDMQLSAQDADGNGLNALPVATHISYAWCMNRIVGTSGNDTVDINFDADNSRFEVSVNSGPLTYLGLAPAGVATNLFLRSEGDDTLVLHNTWNTPSDSVSNITFENATNTDRLIINGSGGDDEIGVVGNGDTFLYTTGFYDAGGTYHPYGQYAAPTMRYPSNDPTKAMASVTPSVLLAQRFDQILLWEDYVLDTDDREEHPEWENSTFSLPHQRINFGSPLQQPTDLSVTLDLLGGQDDIVLFGSRNADDVLVTSPNAPETGWLNPSALTMLMDPTTGRRLIMDLPGVDLLLGYNLAYKTNPVTYVKPEGY